ncbi:heterokaryon incompatibility protein-domain-containing protein [Rhexocercosporidium sp. MPI-PUGE-AT-0058]|nr:heterokaryon incompatibility protein-domain-containing protein [Rhexocercosporidium sp. MPI-PUGE-AT-0058]
MLAKIYENLNLSSSKKEIRILHLLPALNWEDGIQCRLSVVCLSNDDRLQYQALSYVWGDARITIPIDVNGFRFDATKNLVEALRALRLQSEERILWIDAICINQANVDERNRQVSMMTEIYRNSLSTVAWLGPSHRESDKRPPEQCYDAMESPLIVDTDLASSTDEARDVWTELPENHHLQNGPFVLWKRPETDISLVDSFRSLRVMALPQFHIFPEFNQPGWTTESYQAVSKEMQLIIKYMGPVSSVPWWSRTWTAQETVLPKDLQFMCGPYVVSYRVFDQACNACNNRMVVYTAMQNSGDPGFDLDLSLLKSYVGNMASINLFRALFHLGAGSVGLDTIWKPKNSGELCVRELFTRFSLRLATDPRDKVFGVLGLASPPLQEQLIQPDYRLTVSQAYQLALVSTTRASNHLDLIPYVSGTDVELETDGAVRPSWLPVWNDSTDKLADVVITREWDLNLVNQTGDWKDCNMTYACIGLLNLYSDGVLELQGHRIATVLDVEPTGDAKVERRIFTQGFSG